MPAERSSTADWVTLRGGVVNPEYRAQENDAYAGNPLLEALPPILEEEDVADLIDRPPYQEAQRHVRKGVKVQLCLQAVQNFFQPLAIHADLEERLSTLIRQGYVGRNPAHPAFWRETKARVDALAAGPRDAPALSPVDAPALALIICGDSGNGKSRGVRRLLRTYPQVIIHNTYGGRELWLQQVVYLRVECPRNGSLMNLVAAFFEAVDAELRTPFAQEMRRRRLTLDNWLIEMANVCANIHLGVLVIDELQRISLAKAGGTEEFLNFLERLFNVIGVPVVVIGTPKMRALLATRFATSRRGSQLGSLTWWRMHEDSSDWATFLMALWPLQYTRERYGVEGAFLLPDPAVGRALYWYSQGIPGIAIALYFAAQRHVIHAENRADDERVCLTVETVTAVFDTEFDEVRDGIQALQNKSGTKTEVSGEVMLFREDTNDPSRGAVTPPWEQAAMATGAMPNGQPEVGKVGTKKPPSPKPSSPKPPAARKRAAGTGVDDDKADPSAAPITPATRQRRQRARKPRGEADAGQDGLAEFAREGTIAAPTAYLDGEPPG